MVDQAQRCHTEEAMLVRRVQAGDIEAFEILFRQYGATISYQAINLVGNATEAAEVVQEVFLTLVEKARTFHGEAALLTWLYCLTAEASWQPYLGTPPPEYRSTEKGGHSTIPHGRYGRAVQWTPVSRAQR